MLGFDTPFQNDFADDENARISASEQILLLPRDVGVLKRKEITHGYYVRTSEPIEQPSEIVRRFDLATSLRPFARCLECVESLEDATPKK
jgi:uncharacterized protein with PIN domain